MTTEYNFSQLPRKGLIYSFEGIKPYENVIIDEDHLIGIGNVIVADLQRKHIEETADNMGCDVVVVSNNSPDYYKTIYFVPQTNQPPATL